MQGVPYQARALEKVKYFSTLNFIIKYKLILKKILFRFSESSNLRLDLILHFLLFTFEVSPAIHIFFCPTMNRMPIPTCKNFNLPRQLLTRREKHQIGIRLHKKKTFPTEFYQNLGIFFLVGL